MYKGYIMVPLKLWSKILHFCYLDFKLILLQCHLRERNTSHFERIMYCQILKNCFNYDILFL